MMSYVGITLLYFVAATFAQVPPQPKQCVISWKDVTTDQFTVRWPKTFQCRSGYIVELLQGYRDFPLREVNNVEDPHFTFSGLKSGAVYGARVTCVGRLNMKSMPSEPCRTRTLTGNDGSILNTFARTAPVGACGPGHFTCARNASCIDADLWCDGVVNCEDSSDETSCNVLCPEVTSFHPHGEFTCSNGNRAGSTCTFQCEQVHWEPEGSWHMQCLERGWSDPTPTCRLLYPEAMVDNNGAYSYKIQLYIFPDQITDRKFWVTSVIDMDTNQPYLDYTFTYSLDSYEEGYIGMLNNLKPNKRYLIKVVVEDQFNKRSREVLIEDIATTARIGEAIMS